MNEQMIEDELQHKLAEAIDNVIWPLADWDGDRLNASFAAGKAARAAHSVMAAKIEELTDLPRLIELQRTAAPDCEREDGWNAALDRAAEVVRTALAPYPERRSE